MIDCLAHVKNLVDSSLIKIGEHTPNSNMVMYTLNCVGSEYKSVLVSMGTRVESPSFSKPGARLLTNEQRVQCVTQASTGLIAYETLLYANERNSGFQTPSTHPQSKVIETQPNKIA